MIKEPVISIDLGRWHDICGILDLAPSTTIASFEGFLIRTVEHSDKLESKNKRLRDASDAFRARFNEWIMQQDEGVKLSTALAFGAEYDNLIDA
jgi:hypothetical protein